MDKLVLSPAFKIGHNDIDAEHAELVEILNDMSTGYISKDIGACEKKWQLFCVKLERHFINEEEIMARFNYTIDDHDNCHQILLNQTKAAGENCVTLTDWESCLLEMRGGILSQILKHDLYFAEYLITIGYNDI